MDINGNFLDTYDTSMDIYGSGTPPQIVQVYFFKSVCFKCFSKVYFLKCVFHVFFKSVFSSVFLKVCVFKSVFFKSIYSYFWKHLFLKIHI